MKQNLRILNIGLMLLAALVLAFSQSSLLNGQTAQWIIFACVMVLTGIPHGAVDHVVFFNNEKPAWGRFLALYLGLIVLYGALWYLLPSLSLALFLLMTCYHFGQSEWFFVDTDEKNPAKVLLYMSWGAWLLIAFFYFQFETSLEILNGLLEPAVWLPIKAEYGLIAFLSLTVSWVGLLLWFLVKKQLGVDSFGFSVLLSAILCIMIASVPLPISFAIYFGGWHALKAIQAERGSLGEGKAFSLKGWIKAAIPFSLLSFAGIAMLVWLSFSGIIGLHPAMIFFIAISVLTLPHMVIMTLVYREGKNT